MHASNQAILINECLTPLPSLIDGKITVGLIRLCEWSALEEAEGEGGGVCIGMI